MSRRFVWVFLACGIPCLASLPGACSAPAKRALSAAPRPLATTLPTTAASMPTTATGPSTQSTTTQSTTTQSTTTQSTTTESTTVPSAAKRSTHPTEPVPPLLTGVKEGTYLADRVGRFHFNALGPYPYFYFWQESRRVEIELLPNRNLMAIEQAAFWDDHLRFRVSGLVTNYNGRDYLLVERVTRVIATTGPATTTSTTHPTTLPTTYPATAPSSTQP